MRFAVFTKTLPSGATVYVNPNQVVSVDTFNNFTMIHTSVPKNEGNGMVTIGVTQGVAEVVTALQVASNG